LNLDLPEAAYRGVLYEYAVLVTSLQDEVRTIGQHYRDRGDSKNNFDELKNQWGWAGFTTHDRNRCQVMARITALIYNWWMIYMRLGIPDQHAEAITSRPLALHGIARRTRHSNQTTVEVTSTHSKALVIAAALTKVSGFLQRIKATAEQLTQVARWRLILRNCLEITLPLNNVLGYSGEYGDTDRNRGSVSAVAGSIGRAIAAFASCGRERGDGPTWYLDGIEGDRGIAAGDPSRHR
jgi:hypothetical protein